MNVGIIGLGIMGSAMSASLVKSGVVVTGFDVSAEAVARFRAEGGRSAASPREVAAASDVIITSLPSAAALEATFDGPSGLGAAGKNGLVIIEASTFPLDVKLRGKALAERSGMIMLDCPLSGTGAQARNRDLSIYASGDRAAYEKCIDVFRGFGRSWYYLGEFGNGSKMKYVANLLVTIHNVAAAEALVLGEKAGLPLDTVLNVIKDGAGNSRMFEVRGPMMVAGVYEPATMKMDVYQKDIDIISAYANSVGSPTPLFDASLPVYTEARAKGWDKLDTGAVCKVLEERVGIMRDPAQSRS